MVCAQAVFCVDLPICHLFLSHVPVMCLATIRDLASVCFRDVCIRGGDVCRFLVREMCVLRAVLVDVWSSCTRDAMASKCGPVFGPVFWPQMWLEKSEARLSGFTFFEPHLGPFSGPKNETTTVGLRALCCRAAVRFLLSPVESPPLPVRCTILCFPSHLYEKCVEFGSNQARSECCAFRP